MENPGRKTLALFTSYRDLRAVQAALPPQGGRRAYSVFAQGEGESPAELLVRVRGVERGLLLGTAGLWQGIDLPGEALEVLVLARLPFGVPTDPRFAARSEAVESEGGNPFFDLYLPEAVLRFKQGFGRLIRRRSDRGLLVVLDPRLLTKSYGKRFLRALPVEVRRVADGAAVVREGRDWWRDNGRSGGNTE
jgi:Rad3-related DNA helicase